MGTQRPDLPVSPSVVPVGPRGTGQRPVVIDLCCGLGGWSKAFLEEGWDAIGFDIERHEYGDKRYPGELILKSILEVNGHDLRHAVNPALIVASPPCQEFSYMAMPFSRGKKIAKALRGEGEFPEGYTGSRTIAELTALYRACFRIARECGVPIVLENVKGAQPWVGRAQANFGSYYLWGDIANVGGRVVRPDRIAFGMPAVKADRVKKRDGRNFHVFDNGGGSSPSFNGGDHETRGVKTVGHANIRDGHTHTRHLTNQRESAALKVPGIKLSEVGFNVAAAQRWREEQANGVKCTGQKHGEEYAMTRGPIDGLKGPGGDWFLDGRQGQDACAEAVNSRAIKHGGDCFSDPSWPGKQGGTKQTGLSGEAWFNDGAAKHGSRSDSRKAASAMIAEIPFDLAQHIARVFKP